MKVVAVDFGTTTTVVAVRTDDGAASLLSFGTATRMPSAVYLQDRKLLTGVRATQSALRDVARYEATPKRELTAGTTRLPLGGRPGVTVLDAVTEVLRAAISRVDRTDDVRWVITHPADWGATQTAVLRAAYIAAGAVEPVLISEPVAAAWAVVPGDARVAGARFAIFDWGGGTFDSAVVEWNGTEFEVRAHHGDSRTGGEDTDARLAEYLLSQLPPEQLASADDATTAGLRRRHEFRTDVRMAKEELSSDTSTSLQLGDASITVTRAELNRLAGPLVDICIQSLLACLAAADVTAEDLAGIYLTGDASRLVLVADRVRSALRGHHPRIPDDAKAVVALGATYAAARSERVRHAAPTPSPPPPTPGPPPPTPGPPTPGPVPRSARTAPSHEPGRWISLRPSLGVNAAAATRQLATLLGATAQRQALWSPEVASFTAERDPFERVHAVYYPSAPPFSVADAIADPRRVVGDFLTTTVTSISQVTAFRHPAFIVGITDPSNHEHGVMLMVPTTGWLLMLTLVGRATIAALGPRLQTLADVGIGAHPDWVAVPAGGYRDTGSNWLDVPAGYRVSGESTGFSVQYDGEATLGLELFRDPSLDGSTPAVAAAAALSAVHRDIANLDLVFEGDVVLPQAGHQMRGYLLSGPSTTVFTAGTVIAGRHLRMGITVAGASKKKRFGGPPALWGPLTSLLYYIESRG